MKNILPVMLAALVAVQACRDKEVKKETTEKRAENDYLPVQDFIKEDIRRTDSFAGGILKKTTIEGKHDSTFIQPQEFHDKASMFFSSELDSANFRQNFRESSFMDETTETLQFVYESTNSQNLLRKVIVYIKPSLELDKVNRIYIEKELIKGDTSIQEKLTWKMQEYFSTVLIKEINGKTFTEIQKVIWDPLQFAEE